MYNKLSFFRYSFSYPIFKQLEENNIIYAVIKGEPLSILSYKNTGQRNSRDIDILISKADLSKVNYILINNGFTNKKVDRIQTIICNNFSHQIPPYKKTISNIDIEIDVNYDILWGEYEGDRIDIEEFLSDVYSLEIFGIKVYTLPPEKAFIQLVLHHYKEMNSLYHLYKHNCIRESMFKDIYFLLVNNKDFITPIKILELCEKYGVKKYIFYMIYYTNKIYKNKYLQEIINLLESDEGIFLLDKYGLNDKERKTWKWDFEIRLNESDLSRLIKNDLNQDDLLKIQRCTDIFGA